MADYLSELSQALNATAYPEAKPFRSEKVAIKSKGAVIGEREGLILCVGLASIGNDKGLVIGIRARTMDQKAVAAVKTLPRLKSFIGLKAAVTLKEADLAIFWRYALKKPAADEVRAAVQEVIMCLTPFVTRFDGKCEDCHNVAVSGLVLKNGTPGYHCAACQARIIAGEQQRKEEYARKPANHALGVLAGVGATVLAAVVWGLFVAFVDYSPKGEWHPKLHAVGAMLIGMAGSYAITKATGKVTRFGQGLAVLLAFAGKMLADSIVFGIWITKEEHVAWSVPVQLVVMHMLPALKISGGWQRIILGCDVFLSAIVPTLPWAKMPNFKVTFEPLASGGGASKALAFAQATK